MIFLCSLLILGILSPLWGQPYIDQKTSDHPMSVETIKVDVAKSFDFWKQRKVFSAKNLADKVAYPPNELITYLLADNKAQGWPNRPKPHKLLPTEAALLKQAIEALPAWLQKAAAEKLAGIFFVNDLGGTGYTDYIYDQSGRRALAFLVFDKLIFKQKANEWASWKESSTFAFGPHWRLKMSIEAAQNDSISGALSFILLHELGHAFSVGEDFHPPWDKEPSLSISPERFEFSKLSWVANKKLVPMSLFEADLPWRKNLSFYTSSKSKIQPKDVRRVYRDLDTHSNFVGLYAATNPGDDFADTFAVYVHTHFLKKPYRIDIFKGNELAYKFENCLGQARCKAKTDFMKSYFDKLIAKYSN